MEKKNLCNQVKLKEEGIKKELSGLKDKRSKMFSEGYEFISKKLKDTY